jgi:hypothetical protein
MLFLIKMAVTLASLIVAVILLVIILIISAVILSNQNQPVVVNNDSLSYRLPLKPEPAANETNSEFHYNQSCPGGFYPSNEGGGDVFPSPYLKDRTSFQ